MWAKRCQGPPRCLPDGSRGAQDSQAALGAPRTPPKRLQGRPRCFQDSPSSAQDTFQTAPGEPKTPPRQLQDASRSLQDSSKSAQELRRRSQPPTEGHRGLQALFRRPSAEQGPPNDASTRPSCGQSLSNPTPSTTKALCSSTCRISTATDNRSIN